jgi:hypothetical protein
MTFIGGEEEGCCGCVVGVVHGGIPQDGACPLAGGAHSGGGQYSWPGRSAGTLAWMADWRQWWPVSTWRRWRPVSTCIGGCSAVGDPLHDITGAGPI